MFNLCDYLKSVWCATALSHLPRIRIMADYAEIRSYDHRYEVQDYLANGVYPEEATKAVKGVIRKRAKKFQLVDGVLHYKKTLKTGRLRLRQVTYCS